MLTFRGVVLWIHLAGIVAWVGGLLAVPFVAAPVLRRMDHGREAVNVLVRRFQRLSRELVFVILLSGIFNVINAGALTGFAYTNRYLLLVGVKLGLFLVMAANQAWYSLALVPADRTAAAWWSAVSNVALAAIVLYLGLSLRYG